MCIYISNSWEKKFKRAHLKTLGFSCVILIASLSSLLFFSYMLNLHDWVQKTDGGEVEQEERNSKRRKVV